MLAEWRNQGLRHHHVESALGSGYGEYETAQVPTFVGSTAGLRKANGVVGGGIIGEASSPRQGGAVVRMCVAHEQSESAGRRNSSFRADL